MDYQEKYVDSSFSHTLKIPKEWEFMPLNQVIDIIGGSQPPKSDFSNEEKDGYIRLIQIRDYKSDENKVFIPIEKAKRLVNKNEIMIGRYGPPIFQILRGLEGAYNVALMKAVPVAGVLDNDYLYFYLKNKDLFNYVESASDRTAGQSGVNKSHLEKYPVGVPPLAEQKVIADKLDSLLAQVDNIKNRLDALPTIIKRFKQSVLSAAVSGRLTDIINQRAFISLGDAGVIIKTGPFGSALHKADYVQDGVPVINPMHINDGKIYPSNLMTITKEKFTELAAWHLKYGDVIIGRRGEMGRASVFKSQQEMLCGTGSMILRGDESVLPDYLSIIVRSPVAVAYFNNGSVGTTMVNLNQAIIKELKVYFPSLEEQTEIVRRVEQLFAYADQIEQQVKTAQNRVNSLTQAILAKAFRGELTADWRAANPHLISGENSAQALLAKIKAERDKPKKTSKQQTMFNE